MPDDPRERDWPKIRSRTATRLSPWIELITREVEFAPGAEPQIYHAVGQADYLAIVAVAPDGRLPLVRQYRPAVETFTWELPAGLVDAGEDPIESCRRELLEETGLPAVEIHPLGINAPCTGRLSNRIHVFHVAAGEPAAGFRPEPGIEVRLVAPAELVRMIRSGEFSQQLHLGALMQAELSGRLALPR